MFKKLQQNRIRRLSGGTLSYIRIKDPEFPVTFPKSTEKNYIRPPLLTACIFPIAFWILSQKICSRIKFSWDGIWFLCMEARIRSSKNRISGYVRSCRSGRTPTLLLLTLLPFRFTLPLLFTLAALLLLLPGDRSHHNQIPRIRSQDKIPG